MQQGLRPEPVKVLARAGVARGDAQGVAGRQLGREIDLLRALPKTERNIAARAEAKDPEVVRISRQFGDMYFDGPRAYGYGGYRYDGRWIPVARDIIEHFDLKPGDRLLDVGCAKGFLVKDLLDAMPGLEVFGVDISEYAVRNGHPDAIGRLQVGDVRRLPYPDGALDAVIALDVVHNLDREQAKAALAEIERVSHGRAFVRVDSYHTQEQKAAFERWALTARHHDTPAGWRALFAEAGYTGDYTWTVIE